jgi:hypothetical protein
VTGGRGELDESAIVELVFLPLPWCVGVRAVLGLDPRPRPKFVCLLCLSRPDGEAGVHVIASERDQEETAPAPPAGRVSVAASSVASSLKKGGRHQQARLAVLRLQDYVSTPLPINLRGSYFLACRHQKSSEVRYLSVDVSKHRGTCTSRVHERQLADSPLRVVNQSSVSVCVAQLVAASARSTNAVRPGDTRPLVLDDFTAQPIMLRVLVLVGAESKGSDTQSFNVPLVMGFEQTFASGAGGFAQAFSSSRREAKARYSLAVSVQPTRNSTCVELLIKDTASSTAAAGGPPVLPALDPVQALRLKLPAVQLALLGSDLEPFCELAMTGVVLGRRALPTLISVIGGEARAGLPTLASISLEVGGFALTNLAPDARYPVVAEHSAPKASSSSPKLPPLSLTRRRKSSVGLGTSRPDNEPRAESDLVFLRAMLCSWPDQTEADHPLEGDGCSLEQAADSPSESKSGTLRSSKKNRLPGAAGIRVFRKLKLQVLEGPDVVGAPGLHLRLEDRFLVTMLDFFEAARGNGPSSHYDASRELALRDSRKTFVDVVALLAKRVESEFPPSSHSLEVSPALQPQLFFHAIELSLLRLHLCISIVKPKKGEKDKGLMSRIKAMDKSNKSSTLKSSGSGGLGNWLASRLLDSLQIDDAVLLIPELKSRRVCFMSQMDFQSELLQFYQPGILNQIPRIMGRQTFMISNSARDREKREIEADTSKEVDDALPSLPGFDVLGPVASVSASMPPPPPPARTSSRSFQEMGKGVKSLQSISKGVTSIGRGLFSSKQTNKSSSNSPP